MNNTKTQLYLLLTSLLFWLSSTGTAQKYLPYFQKFTLEDGLSSPYFNSFLQEVFYAVEEYSGVPCPSDPSWTSRRCNKGVLMLIEGLDFCNQLKNTR